MLHFISFGSGSSGNCYYLYTDTDGLLIDAGVGMRTLKKHFADYGLSFAHIRHIIVTHDHADHIKAVGSLSHALNVKVYATQPVLVGIEKNYCVKKKLDLNRQVTITKNVSFQLGAFIVTSFEIPHDSSDNVGYKIVCENTVFVIMTDVGRVTESMKPFIGEADYLVMEANHDVEMLKNGPYPEHLKVRISCGTGHLNNEASGLAIAQNATPKLKHVWLCHLSEENNHPELARKTVEQVLREHGIVPGKDFLLDVLRRRLPTGIETLA